MSRSRMRPTAFGIGYRDTGRFEKSNHTTPFATPTLAINGTTMTISTDYLTSAYGLIFSDSSKSATNCFNVFSN